MRTALIMEK